MTGLSLFRRLLSWTREIWRQPQPSPEEWLEEMTARLELELIELRRVLAESLALLKSAERQQLRQPCQEAGVGDELLERQRAIEGICQTLSRLESQYAQVRGRKNWYLSRLKLALVQEKLESITTRWDRLQASDVFADLETMDF